MNKSLLLRVLLYCAVLPCLTSCAESPVSIKTVSFDSEQFSSDYVKKIVEEYENSGAVYLILDEGWEYDPGETSYWSLYRIYNARYVIINPDVEELTTFALFTEKNVIIKDAEFIVKPLGGGARHYSKEVLIKQEDEGGVRYKFVFPDVGQGTVIDYRVTTKFQSVDISDIALDYEIDLHSPYPCMHRRAYFIVPKSWGLSCKYLGDEKIKNLSTYNKEQKHGYIYRESNIPALPDERYSPYRQQDSPNLNITLTYIETAGSYFKSEYTWDWLAEQHRVYLLENDFVFSNLIGKTTKRLISKTTDPKQRLLTVVDYVRRHIHLDEYAKGGALSEVLKKKRGTAKQISGLTYAMLKKADIDVDFLLIHGAEKGAFDRAFVSVSEMENSALRATIDGESIYIAPYLDNLGVGLLPPNLQGRMAIPISEKGPGEFFVTPVMKPEDSQSEFFYSIAVDETGLIEVEERQRYKGLSAYGLREQLYENTTDEKQKYLEELATYQEGGVEIMSSKLFNTDDPEKPLEIELKYRIDDLVTFAGNEILMQTGGLVSKPNRSIKEKRSEHRMRPVQIHYSEIRKRRFVITYPETWSLETKFRSRKLKTGFGIATLIFKKSSRQIAIEQSLVLNAARGPAESIDVLQRLLDEGENIKISAIVFKRGDVK